MPTPPFCFVLMPFGEKPDPIFGRKIDFDAVFERAIRPGIEQAGMEPLRGDLETSGGIIHRHFFERLLTCPFAVADLTTHNANVFYEYGVRHAVRPFTTVAVTAHPESLPFDVRPLRVLQYGLNEANALDETRLPAFLEALARALSAARARTATLGADVRRHADSPLYQLIDRFPAPDLSHLRADLFPEMVRTEQALGAEIDAIRAGADHRDGQSLEQARAALDDVRARMQPFGEADMALAIRLMLAYRAISAWDRMVELFEALPPDMRRAKLPREQYAMALNRLSRRGKDRALVQKALAVLGELERERKSDPETCGLVGRIHKDLWLAAREAGDPAAAGHLNDAIAAYRRGFHADWRDTYPGINLATLLSAKATADAIAELAAVLPVLRFGTERRVALAPDDYWQHATLLEIAVLDRDGAAAGEHLANACARIAEDFQPRTTADNLAIILDTAADPDALAFVPRLREALLSRCSGE